MKRLKVLLVLGLLLAGAHVGSGKTVGIWKVAPLYVTDAMVKTLEDDGWRVVTIGSTNLADGVVLADLDVVFIPGGWEAYRLAGFRARRNLVKFVAGGKGLLDSAVSTTRRPLFPQVGTTIGYLKGARISAIGERGLARTPEPFVIDTNTPLLKLQAGSGGEPFAMVGAEPVGISGSAYSGRYVLFGGSFTRMEILDGVQRQKAAGQILLTAVETKALMEKTTQQVLLDGAEDELLEGFLAEAEPKPPQKAAAQVEPTAVEDKARQGTPAQQVLLACLDWLASAPPLAPADRLRLEQQADVDFLRMERRADWTHNESLWPGPPLSVIPEVRRRLATLPGRHLHALNALRPSLSGEPLSRCLALTKELQDAVERLDRRYQEVRAEEDGRILKMSFAELAEDNPFLNPAGVLKRIAEVTGKTEAERAAMAEQVRRCAVEALPDAPLDVALFLHGDAVAEWLLPQAWWREQTERWSRTVAELQAVARVSPPEAPVTVPERMRADPLMAPYYTGRILPTPQKAEYRDEFLPMAKVAIIVGKDVENPAPLIGLLTDRLVRYGGAAEVVDAPGPGHTAVVSLGDTELARQAKDVPAVPEREQGYILLCASESGRPLVILKGKDRLGLVWGISSLVQLIHWRDGQTLARAAAVVDYPRLPKRGVIFSGRELIRPPVHSAGKSPDTKRLLKQNRQFIVMCKYNEPVYQSFIQADCYGRFWKYPDKLPPDATVEEDLAAMTETLTPLGITWWAGIRPHAAGADTPEELSRKLCADEESVRGLLHFARMTEKAGGHLSIILDDIRFPITPYDQERLGSVREVDTYVVTNVMARLKKDYPKARLLVCPPYYWGPVGGVGRAGDGEYGGAGERDAYLRAVGERWQPEIEVFWTGQQVNGAPLGKKSYVEWWTGLTRRKPYLWQNSGVTWYRAYFYHYGAEPINTLKDFYWDGFHESIGWYGFNSDFPVRCIANLVSADFQWNPDAHDPKESVKEAASKLIGPQAWDALERFSSTLSYFDRFASEKNYRWLLMGPFHDKDSEMYQYAAQNIDILEERIAKTEAIYQELLALSPVAVSNWTGCAGFMGVAKGVVARTRSNPDLARYRKAPAQRKVAEKAGDYCAASNDYFVAACNFRGFLTEVSDSLLDSVLGDGPTHPAIVLSDVLETDARPWIWKEDLADTFELWISARQGPGAGEVTVTLNNKELFKGATAFDGEAPSTRRVAIPPGVLKEGDNTLKIHITRKGSAGLGATEEDVPPLALQYVVFKRMGRASIQTSQGVP